MAFEQAPALCQMDSQDWPDPREDARVEYEYAHRIKSNSYVPPIGGGSEK